MSVTRNCDLCRSVIADEASWYRILPVGRVDDAEIDVCAACRTEMTTTSWPLGKRDVKTYKDELDASLPSLKTVSEVDYSKMDESPPEGDTDRSRMLWWAAYVIEMHATGNLDGKWNDEQEKARRILDDEHGRALRAANIGVAAS